MIYNVSPTLTTLAESPQESISYMDIDWFEDKQAQEILRRFFIEPTKTPQNYQV